MVKNLPNNTSNGEEFTESSESDKLNGRKAGDDRSVDRLQRKLKAATLHSGCLMISLPTLPFPTPTILLTSIAIAAALVYLPFLVVAFARLQAGYDAATPRTMFDKLPDYAKRATWAHQNAFESFGLYAAAALMAYVTQAESALVGWAAIAYLLARLLFPAFYILNIPIGRSLMFAIGSLCIGTLFVLSISGHP